jgi:protein O-mannosyl-transferase
VALLVLAAVAPYAQTLLYGYILDDTTIIRGNAIVHSWSGVFSAWTHPYWAEEGPSRSGLYRPLLIALFTVIWNAGHRFALWFHVFVVGMHACATWLVWRLLRRGVGRWPAFAAALWFAVQPVHVEAVANITNSSEVLVLVWTALLALFMRRVDERTPAGAPVGVGAAIAIALLFAGAAFTKESGFVAPALAAIWVWGWCEDGAPAGILAGRTPAAALLRWKRPIVACGIVFAIVIAARLLVLGGVVSAASIAAPGLEGLSAWQRVWAMLSLGPLAFTLLFWPVHSLSPHYGPEVLTALGPSVAGVLTLALLAGAAAVSVRVAYAGDRRPLAAIAWILAAMLPASNLLTPTGQILAERTMYGASVGAAMLIAWAVSQVLARTAGYAAFERRVSRLAVGVVVGFSVLRGTAMSVNYATVWETHDRLFSYLMLIAPDGYRGHWLGALRARDRGELDESLREFARAYAIYPRDRQLTIDYANTLLLAKQPKAAAAMAAHLMDFADLRHNSGAMGLYLDAIAQGYGADSARAMLRVLAPVRVRGPAP